MLITVWLCLCLLLLLSSTLQIIVVIIIIIIINYIIKTVSRPFFYIMNFLAEIFIAETDTYSIGKEKLIKESNTVTLILMERDALLNIL